MTSMNQPHVVVEISPAGSVKFDAKCFSGSGCAAATEQLEVVLGGAGKRSKKKKPEFHAPSGLKQAAKATF